MLFFTFYGWIIVAMLFSAFSPSKIDCNYNHKALNSEVLKLKLPKSPSGEVYMQCQIASQVLLFVLLISTFTSYSLLPNVGAQVTTAVKVVAPSTVGDPGTALPTTPFTVTLTVENVNNLYAWQVKLYFNESILYTKATWVWLPSNHVFQGKQIIEVQPVVSNDTQGWYVFFGASLLGDQPKFSGTGTLFQMNFTGIKSGFSFLDVSQIPDTSLLDFIGSDLVDIPFNDIDGSVQVSGLLIGEQPSTITISVRPSSAYEGQTVTINGTINPAKPQVDVTIERKAAEDVIWDSIATVKTNGSSVYTYDWQVDVSAGSYELRASWLGDATHAGDTSNVVTFTVKAITTKLTINFADGRNLNVTTRPNVIGEETQPLPTPPVTFNITVYNTVDLCEWQITLYYNSNMLNWTNASIPSDNVFGKNFNSTQLEKGADQKGSFVIFGARFNGTGPGFNGRGTFCQMNFAGITVGESKLGVATENQSTFLKSSEGQSIPFNMEFIVGNKLFDDGLPVQVVGEMGARAKFFVVNPKTGGSKFEFYSDTASTGFKFNATVRVQNVTQMYAWKVKMRYNSTVINATKVLQPSWDNEYVFYGQNSNFKHVLESGNVLINDTLPSTESLFSGSGVLLIIEFEILKSPPANGTLSSPLSITNEYTGWTSDGIEWENRITEDGSYSFTSKASPGEGKPFDFMAYIPYVAVGITIIVIVAAVILLKRRKTRSST